ncbi:hypothetical protein B11Cv2_001500 [Bartonella sp. 1-1C]|nr:hypothetical protein B11Cv2_001500 [Bartonella sp. 1-1C]
MLDKSINNIKYSTLTDANKLSKVVTICCCIIFPKNEIFLNILLEYSLQFFTISTTTFYKS